MITQVLLAITLLTGVASQYAPGKMQSVINVRQTRSTSYTPPQDLSKYDGFIAMESCSELGKEYYIKPNDPQYDFELFLVVDCSGHSETTQWMLHNNIIAEIDYGTAERWRTVGYGIDIVMVTPSDFIATVARTGQAKIR